MSGVVGLKESSSVCASSVAQSERPSRGVEGAESDVEHLLDERESTAESLTLILKSEGLSGSRRGAV